MRLDEAADVGKKRKRDGALAAEAAEIEARRARSEEDRRKLDVVYGIDARAQSTAIAFAVMAALLGVGTAWATHSLPDAPATLPWIYAMSATLALLAIYLWYAAAQAPKKRAAERAWLSALPFPFDVAGYERTLIEHDFMTGWMRVTLRFAPGMPVGSPELAAHHEKLVNAAIGFGAAEATWANAVTLRIRSPQMETRLRVGDSDEDNARPLHVWFRAFAALPEGPLVTLARAGTIERVSARIGWFADGSWTVTQKEVDDDALEAATRRDDT